MLVPPYTNIQDSFNCFLVRPYLKILRHALRVMRVAVPIPPVASASVLLSAAVAVVGVVRPL